MKNITVSDAYRKVVSTGKRIPELETVILKDAGYAYIYARDVIQGKWPEAEQVIMTNANLAYNYAEGILKSRWSEAESIIAKHGDTAYFYAKQVIKGRFPEAEPAISQYAYYAYLYSLIVTKTRFYEAEEVISKSDDSIAYTNLWFDEPVVAKNNVDEFDWLRFGAQGYFAPASLFERRASILDSLVEGGE